MLTEQLAAYYNSSVSGRKEKFLNKKRVVKREASKKKDEVSSSDEDEDEDVRSGHIYFYLSDSILFKASYVV